MKRKKRFKWTKPFLIFGSIVILSPLIANAIPTDIKQVFDKPKVELKEIPKPIGETKTPTVTEIKVEDKIVTPIATPTPTETVNPSPAPTLTPTPITSPTIEAAISCSITNTRPPNSKWIYKDKLVGMGVRYTTDIYELKPTLNDQSKTYYYILHDKITRYAKNKVVGNFAIAYQKQKIVQKIQTPFAKSWEVEFKGCGLDTKEDKSVPLVTIFDDEEMPKSMKLIGIQQVAKVGLVTKPTTNIRVMNELDITEEK